jgi:hypothetical protein
LLLDSRVQERVDAERQRIVEEIVQKIDEIIQVESDHFFKPVESLTQRAAAMLLVEALCLELVLVNANYCDFDENISRAVKESMVAAEILQEPVTDWITMQVAKRFLEKASIPFDDRLREHDRNN